MDNQCGARLDRLGYFERMKTILTPIDFSGATDAVVEEAAALARALSGRVVLLTIIQPPVIAHEYAAVMENLAEITAAGEKQAARKLAELEQKLQVDLIATESVQLLGAPIPSIVDQAKKLAALYDLLVGSTTHGVLMRAPCPVVIVPPAKNAKARNAAKEQVVAV
jgi:nucleotide-binding universal stress UspA family protein